MSVARVRGLSPRRVRGLSLLASLSLAVIALPLAAFSILPWWAVLVTVAVLVADLPLLRHAAITDRAARRAKRPADRPKVRAARYSASTSPAVEDQEAGAAEGASPNASQAEVDPKGWAPVPVPPPTYTLKAKAERPLVVPDAFTEPMGAGSSGPGGVAEESELIGLMDRRSAAGA
jgi:hypothetical protein